MTKSADPPRESRAPTTRPRVGKSRPAWLWLAICIAALFAGLAWEAGRSDAPAFAPTVSVVTPVAIRTADKDEQLSQSGPLRRELAQNSATPPTSPASDGSVLLQVNDDIGEPVPDAVVASLEQTAESESRIRDYLTQHPEQSTVGRWHSLTLAVGTTTRTDGAGQVRLPRSHHVRNVVASKDGRLGDLTLSPTAAGPAVVVLQSGTALRIEGVDAVGNAVSGLELALAWLRPDARDADGEYQVTSLGQCDRDGKYVLEARSRWIAGLRECGGAVATAQVIADVPGGRGHGVPARLDDARAQVIRLSVALAQLQVDWGGQHVPTEGTVKIVADGDRGADWCRAADEVLTKSVRVVSGHTYTVRYESRDHRAATRVVVPAAGTTTAITLVPELAPTRIELSARLVIGATHYSGPAVLRLMNGIPADEQATFANSRAVDVNDGFLSCMFDIDEVRDRWLFVEAGDHVGRIVLPAPPRSTDLGVLTLSPRVLVAEVEVVDPAGAPITNAEVTVVGDLAKHAHVRQTSSGEVAVLCDPPRRAGMIHVSARAHLPSRVAIGNERKVTVRLAPAARFELTLLLPVGVQGGDLIMALESGSGPERQLWYPDPSRARIDSGHHVLAWANLPRDALTLRTATRFPPAAIDAKHTFAAEPDASARSAEVDLRTQVRAIDVKFVDASGRAHLPPGWVAIWHEDPAKPIDAIALAQRSWSIPNDARQCLVVRNGSPPILVAIPVGDELTISPDTPGQDASGFAERSVRLWRVGQDSPDREVRLRDLLTR